AVASISSKVAGLWLPTDNVLASAIPALVKVTNPVKLPVVAGERGMTEAGCLGSISVDYYEIGRMTGQMGADILEGKKKPAEMPVQHVATGTPVFNLKAAEAIGVTIPEELKKGAVLFQ
ncbi:ABC transporter substrate-binding protein, partial [Sutterella wadsworthensis]